MSIVRFGGGSEKVTIDGEKVREKLNLQFTTNSATNLTDFPGTGITASSYDNRLIYNPSDKLLYGFRDFVGVNDAEARHTLVVSTYDGSNWSERVEYSYSIGSPSSYNTGDLLEEAVIYNNEVHFFAGYVRLNFKRLYKWNGTSLQNVTSVPIYPYQIGATTLNNEIYLVGGAMPGDTKSFYKYNGSWTQLADTLVAGKNVATTFKGEIYTINGNNFSKYSTITSSWTNLGTIPFRKGYRPFICSDDKYIYTSDDTTNIWRYNGTSWTKWGVGKANLTGDTVDCDLLNGRLHVLGNVNNFYTFSRSFKEII